MTGMDAIRVPPHATDAEEVLLGGLMILPDKIEAVASELAPEDFYRHDHAAIYRAMLELSGRSKIADAVTLGDYIPEHRTRVYELARDSWSAANVSGYARMIREKAVRRRLIDAATNLASAAFGNETETHVLLADTIGSLMAMQKTESQAEYTLRQAMTLAYKAAQDAKALGGRIPGIPSGLHRLDHLLGGWHNGDLVVLGARPAMGKTAMLLKFALATEAPCGIISAEQPAIQVGARVMSAQSRVDAEKFRNGAFEGEDIESLRMTVERLVDRACLIYDLSNPSIADVVRVARKWKQQHGIQVLFVDYIQRIEAMDRRAPKHERVGEVVRGLKTLARDLDIPVVALCQVTRDVEKRNDRRPNMGDMSDSSEIEKEADQILTLYREAVYYSAFDERGNQIGLNEKGKPIRENIAELTIEKNRHGATGYVECVWIAPTMRFEDLAHVA